LLYYGEKESLEEDGILYRKKGEGIQNIPASSLNGFEILDLLNGLFQFFHGIFSKFSFNFFMITSELYP